MIVLSVGVSPIDFASDVHIFVSNFALGKTI